MRGLLLRCGYWCLLLLCCCCRRRHRISADIRTTWNRRKQDVGQYDNADHEQNGDNESNTLIHLLTSKSYLRDRVFPESAPGMTAQQSPRSQPASFDRAVFAQRLLRVIGAGRRVTERVPLHADLLRLRAAGPAQIRRAFGNIGEITARYTPMTAISARATIVVPTDR